MTDVVRVVSGLIFDREGRVLLTKRTLDATRPNAWEFPGGKVEPGETDAVALVRELDEELGVECSVVRRVAHTTLHLEAEFKHTLYHVTMQPGACPRPLAATDLQWFDPAWAVVWLTPLVPTIYIFHPHVLATRRTS